jgi:hypothetical protein
MTPEGLRSEVPQYLWKRKHMLWGMPMQWLAMFFGGGGLLLALASLKYGWLGVCIGLAVVAALFLWVQYKFRQDEQWDEALLNDLAKRYQHHYGTE